MRAPVLALVWLGWLAADASAAGAGIASQKGGWQLVQAVPRGEVAEPLTQHYARLLPLYLGGKAVIPASTRGRDVDGVYEALKTSDPDRTLMMLTTGMNSRLHDDAVNRHSSPPVLVVQLVLQRSWCLVSAQDVPPRTAEELGNWVAGLGRPLRIGLPFIEGAPDVWVRAMEKKTGVRWQPEVFAKSAEMSVEALLDGRLDLLFDHCAEFQRIFQGKNAARIRPRLQILATSGSPDPSPFPTFTQWRLPTVQPGWMAWFVPSGMGATERARVARGLHAITVREDTQRLIRELRQEPSSLTTEASQIYVARWSDTWKSISHWLDNVPSKPNRSPISVKALE
ncbi:hypothetical protein [Comamonas sp. lk]|uniref:hypothetical protein n=1 Tax=Comamonas sp. lk TaxID=2201272 RepID=UPI0013CE725F|nr:hypothetical protein [Comamonas sp. lk]